MLALWKKSYDKSRQHILKQRHSFADKVQYDQSYCFSSSHIWMCELDHKESWMTKSWCFWSVVLKKTFEGPLVLMLKEINPEYSLEALRLKLQYFGHLMWRADSLEKNLILGKIEGSRRRGWQRMRWLDRITDSMDINLSKLWEILKDREVWHAAIHVVARNWTWLSDWTTATNALWEVRKNCLLKKYLKERNRGRRRESWEGLLWGCLLRN